MLWLIICFYNSFTFISLLSVSLLYRVLNYSNYLNLYKHILGKSLYSNARASRLACEILGINSVESSKIAHIAKETGCLNHILERCTSLGKNSRKILHYLSSLCCDTLGLNLACSGVDGHLTRCKQHITADDGL